MKNIRLIIIPLFILVLTVSQAHGQTLAQKVMDTTFIAPPYLQVGSNPTPQSLEVMWHAADSTTSNWVVEHKQNGAWVKTNVPTATSVTLANLPTHYVYRAMFTGLTPGSTFDYRLTHKKKVVFNATAKALKSPDQPYNFVVFGDVGAGTPEAEQIANGVYNAKPDFVAIPGDIVYEYGLVSEYRKVFWPIYNADKQTTTGAPIMRSVPFIASVGNHDADSRDLDKYPDALAYYALWDQPLNGPVCAEGGAFLPTLKGADANKKSFYTAAGKNYPAMTNFSFDYANAHWTVLDADTYVDWTDKQLTDWVAKDLADSKDKTWHFVLYHHPGFNSSREHYEQQQMRALSPIFEAGKVDIVFNGHVHNYQRSFPLTFKPDNKGTLMVGGKDNKNLRGRIIGGVWKLDTTYNGTTNTKPNGVIYIVTGAGGQHLYNPEQETDPNSWQKFTDKFKSTIHTFSNVSVKGNTLTMSQIGADGKPVDTFTIVK